MISRFNIDIYDKRDSAEVATAAAIISYADNNSAPVIGLATGNTMTGVYEKLVDREARQPGIFNTCHFIQLDEIVVLGGNGDNHSKAGIFSTDIQQQFLGQLNGGYASFIGLPASFDDPEKTVANHLDKIAALGGVDIQLLGIGVNGHIGFNEPPSTQDSICRIVSLAESTIALGGYPANSVGLTLGVAEIMASRRIIMLATSDQKSKIMAKALSTRPTPDCPASLLRNHPDLHIILDHYAASIINSNQQKVDQNAIFTHHG
ncbi:6-phosphogluconolactonase [Paracoccaceae bacterium]|nr:6-phosphogluconolactonase [Paracoccaceae bacterium]